MRLRTIDIIILLTLGTLLITRSIWGLIKDTNINTSTSNSVSGRVKQADIRSIEATTLKVEKHKTVFAIQLDNSNEKFAVDRGISICNLLNSKIKEGDSIKIYYRSSTGEYNTHIFQIEKDNTVIINAEDYSHNESKMIALMAIFGVILIAGTVTWAIKQKQTA